MSPSTWTSFRHLEVNLVPDSHAENEVPNRFLVPETISCDRIALLDRQLHEAEKCDSC